MKRFVAMSRIGIGTALAGLLLVAGEARAADAAVEAAIERARAAGVSTEVLRAIADRAEARGIPADGVSVALATLEGAARRGLPVGSVADKLLEGFAKGVPPERVVPVAQGIVARLAQSDAAFARVPAARRAAVVEEGAEAIRRGVSVDALAALGSEIGNRNEPARLGLAIRELAQLSEARSGTPVAGRALGLMVARGYPDAAVAGLSEQVSEALAEGADLQVLFDEIAARASSGRPMEHLVDPFSETPGEVIRDPGAKRQGPGSNKGKGKALGRQSQTEPPGQSKLERPGTAGSPNAAQGRALGKGIGGKPSEQGPGKGKP